MEVITSKQNPRIKLARKLRLKKYRARLNKFVIEYERDFVRAIAKGYSVDFVLISESAVVSETMKLSLADKSIRDVTYTIQNSIVNYASYRKKPTGFLAVMTDKPAKTLDALFCNDTMTIIGLVSLRKPGNIGAIMRTASACGADGVFLIDTPLDRYNPNIIRNSTGAVFEPTIFEMTSEQALGWFSKNNFLIYGTHLSGSQNLFHTAFEKRSAILFGTEDSGLPEYWSAHSDILLSIPMDTSVTDSLNVSVSAGVCLYERHRQLHYSN